MARRWNLPVPMRFFAAVLSAVLGLPACTSTNVVRVNAASALRTGNHRDAFNAGDVRISPNSELRFCRANGCSDWISASDLRVDDTGAWFDGVGYEWSEVSHCEVKGFDGIKTTGAIIGITAGVAIIIPIALLAMSLKSLPRALPNDGPRSESSFDSGVSTTAALAGVAVAAATSSAKPENDDSGLFYWGATRRRDAATAPRLFSTAARVRSYITLGAYVDSGVAYERDLVTGGAVARLRLADFFEVGAGARLAHTKGMDGTWDTTRMYVVQAGFHSPVTARFALPLGVDVAWGKGELEREIRIPWGFRYTSPSGRWTGTFQPVTPSYAKRADADSGRWTITTGLELGVMF